MIGNVEIREMTASIVNFFHYILTGGLCILQKALSCASFKALSALFFSLAILR